MSKDIKIIRFSVERKYIRFICYKHNRHEWKGRSCVCGCEQKFRIGSNALIDDSMQLWFPVHYFIHGDTYRLPEDWEYKRISCGNCENRGYSGRGRQENCPMAYVLNKKWNKDNISDMKLILNFAKTEGFHGDIGGDGRVKIMFCKEFNESKELPLEEEFKELKCRGDLICEL